MFNRLQKLGGKQIENCFLWGARQTGKSTLLKQHYPHSLFFDLLKSDEFLRLNARPSVFREEVLERSDKNNPIVVDEVQKIPLLMDEVHWLIANHSKKFILCGSSPRKLIRSGANLLGGRAVRYELFPLVFPEIPDFDLLRALNHGLLPPYYSADRPQKNLKGYVGDYLNEEITKEAISRNLTVFTQFMTAAAFSNGEVVNYTNIARDIGVSVTTVKEYFQILSDTLLGRFVSAFRKRPKRRLITAPKFYYFDIGIANVLLNRSRILPGSELFGRAFEHYIYHEISTHAHYSELDYPVTYWRSSSGLEVDFILADHEIAIEVKGTTMVTEQHLRGLKAFMDDYTIKKAIIISADARPRLVGKIHVMPWAYFLNKLWNGDIIS